MRDFFSTRGFCIAFLSLFFGLACGDKDAQKQVAQTTAERLQALRAQRLEIDKEIEILQQSLAEEKNTHSTSQVDTLMLRTKKFCHYIELQAQVNAGASVIVMPRTNPGQVKRVYKTQGEEVAQGEIILQLEDTLIDAQIKSLRPRLSLAQDILARQEKLWREKIGSELDYLQRKNDVDALHAQIESLERNKEQTMIVAPINGILDVLDVREGETFTGMLGNSPQIRILSFKRLKTLIRVPDTYIKNVKKGSTVELTFPDINERFFVRISTVSKFIDMGSRSFLVEAPLPYNDKIRLNMVVKARILDYENAHALVVPLESVRTEEDKKYVYVLMPTNRTQGQDSVTKQNYRVEKRWVRLGMNYDNYLEIVGGVGAGDIILKTGHEQVQAGDVIHF